MPLYQVDSDNIAAQIKPSEFSKERDLQKLFEKNLEILLGVRFVASEFTTGDRQRGRIDTLGLDQDGYPTIIEFKKSTKENVINQGLFYLDWLVDHKGDYTLAAQAAFGSGVKIDWIRPRVILIAESFSEYDKYAVNRIGANIELWTYRKYGNDLLYLDPIFAAAPQPTKGIPSLTTKESVDDANPLIEEIINTDAPVYTLDDHLARKPKEIIDLFEMLRERILGLADEGEIIEKPNKMYIGYKHGKNFCEVRVQSKAIQIWLDIAPSRLDDHFNLVRDVTRVGHYGTGDSEVKLTEPEQVERVIVFIEKSFKETV